MTIGHIGVKSVHFPMSSSIVITGVRRIGKVIAENFLDAGYDMAVVYRQSKDVVQDLQKTAGEKGRTVVPIQADLSQPGEGRRVVEEALNRLGRVEGLVHLASPYKRIPLLSVQAQDLQAYFWSITGSLIEMIQGLIQQPAAVDFPIHVVVFGDWAVDTSPYPGYLPYFSAKGALHAAVRALARELAPQVVINGIAPGPVWRPPEMSQEAWHRILQLTPLKREVSLEDLSQLTRFLMSTTSITGEIIRVDGGRHLAGSADS